MPQRHPEPTKILEIIHLSDIHFGDKNICRPSFPGQGMLKLSELLLRDLRESGTHLPLLQGGEWTMQEVNYDRILCITGDFAQKGSADEFEEARIFLEELRTGLGGDFAEGMDSVFIIPGNHDLEWTEPNLSQRWQNWTNFYNGLYRTRYLGEEQLELVQLTQHPRLPVLVLRLNSEMHIHHQDELRQCGLVDENQLQRIRNILEEAKASLESQFDDMIKVALVHHHPILIPSLMEPGRGVGPGNKGGDPGYDAIMGAPRLLSELHSFGFHLLLHGHKHYPHVFTEDITNAFERGEDQAMLIVAGGTLASTGLPSSGSPTQCYNRIRIHWNPQRKTVRAEVNTRGLITKDPKTYRDLPRSQWHWETCRIVDRDLSAPNQGPPPKPEHWKPKPAPSRDAPSTKARYAEHRRIRFNMPVFELRPALIPKQGYEIRFWIARHETPTRPYIDEFQPNAVTWYAGPKFPTLTIMQKEDPNFCGIFHAYGPMLLQAQLHFHDGSSELAYVYVWFPGQMVYSHDQQPPTR